MAINVRTTTLYHMHLSTGLWGNTRKELRPEVDAPPSPSTQGKATGDSFPVDRNSKTRIAEQLREEAGPCPDHTQTTYFSFSKSGDLTNHTCTERILGSQRGVMSRDALPIGLFSRIHLGQEVCVYTWEDPDIYQI